MLESYIAPLFTGYVDKYIKNLKPEDLSLSLWGGDVVLQNLEINLDVLQQELNLPVEFLSGKIHKFQLHVPWTRIIYDPVVITINTMEFIVKLKDPNDSVTTPAEKSNEDVEETIPDIPEDSPEDLPPGYVQGILNKVINNVSFQIHNIIIKYVEDDIVFSLNLKSLDLHSSDEEWNPAFTELKLPELLLRKVCEIADLTVCLDQRNTSGKIELYEDPVLYKCNLSCRVVSHYKSLSTLTPYENILNIYCESCDFSFTDHQVPMVIRLIKLIIGLYYGSLDLPGCNVKVHTAPKVLDQHKQEHSRLASSNVSDNVTEEPSESWTSWALSMVPGMAPLTEENRLAGNKFDLKTTIGIYITLTTITLKRTNQFSENVIAHQRFEFSPVLCMEVCGCVLECVAVGDILVDLNLGLQSIVGYTVGNQCVCSMLSPQSQKHADEGCDEETLLEDDVFIKVGEPPTKSFSFLNKSLFASYLKDNISQFPQHQTDQDVATEVNEEEVDVADIKPDEDTKELLEEQRVKSYEMSTDKIEEMYGGLFLNYYYELFLPDLNSLENIFLYPDMDKPVKEVSEKRIHIASCQFYVTTKFSHFMIWFLDLVTSNIPERKKKTAVVLDSYVLWQLEIGNLLTRKFTITMRNLETHVMMNDHASGIYVVSAYQEEKEGILFRVDNIEILKVEPMYPVEFISMVEQGKLVKLHKTENLNVILTLKVTGGEVGVSCVNTMNLDSSSHIMLQPTNFEASITYSLLPDTYETKTTYINAEGTFECEKTSIIFTKIQALLFCSILTSWITDVTENEISILGNSVFSHESSKNTSPLMNIDVEGIMLRVFDMADLQGMSGIVSKVLATLQTVGSDGNIESTSLLFQAPFDTENLHDVKSWLSEVTDEKEEKSAEVFIQFVLQYQKENCKIIDTGIPLFGLKMGGVCINIDHLLHVWLTYQIDVTMRKRVTVERQRSILNRSMTTTTSRRTKSYARAFGGSNTSPSSLSKAIEQVPQLEEELERDKESFQTREHYAEWIAKKMNFFKSFCLQVDIESIVIVFPTDKWPSGYSMTSNFVKMVGEVYQDDSNDLSHALVVCLPKLSLHSAAEGFEVFKYKVPVILTHHRKNKETFPWTITCKDLNVFTLFSQKEDIVFNDKLETLYICKPVSWSIYLASTSHNNSVSKTIASLGIIPETCGSKNILPPGRIICSNIAQEKVGNALSGKHVLGFVLHMDWSVCECFVSLKQLQLVSDIISKASDTLNSIALQKAVIESETSKSLSGSTLGTEKKHATVLDGQSQSTASIIDRAECMSTITGSSSIFPTIKGSPDCINVSLWIQCTLPKIKCTILSHCNDNTALYQVISEIDEIMFAFDYQDNVLELTNKIAACVVYYSLLRFDTQPDGWTVIDHNYLLGQTEKYRTSHVDSKTLLSIVYRRTHRHAQSITSPDESDSNNKKVSDLDQSSASISIQEEDITKHEFSVNILPLDLICFPKPILSSLNIFTQILPAQSDSQPAVPVASNALSADHYITVTTLPLLDVHCDSVRIIIPVGEIDEDKSYSCIDNNETVFLFHLQSFDLHSSPVNPISKTVTDRVMYRQIKQSYRDVLKKLKLWNVQYQLDLSNIGLCTTNWQSLESSLPGNFAGLQNPALEWNSQSGYGHKVMTPIFPGFDFKATIAPPIISRHENKMHPVTAAAFEFHSPKEVKLFINSSQIGLALNFVKETNSLVTEVTRIMQPMFSQSKEAINKRDPSADKQVVSTTTSNKFQVPCIELFSSVSSISISVYLKEFKQPLISSIYPAFYINLMQPTFSFTSIKETRFQFKLYNLDIASSSNFEGISSESPVPSPGDFDLPLFSCGLGCIDEKIGSTPVLIDASGNLDKLDAIALHFVLEKPVYLCYNLALDKNIKLFIDNVSSILSNSLKTEKVEAASSVNETSSINEATSLTEISSINGDSSPFKVNLVSVAAKRINASFCLSQNVKDASVNLEYQNLKCCASLRYDDGGNSIDFIDVKSQFDGVEIYFSECGHNSTLLMPTNLKIDGVLKFCLHSGNDLHESLFPKMYVFMTCGLMQLHVNQHLYKIINNLSLMLMEAMSTNSDVSAQQETSIETGDLIDGEATTHEKRSWSPDFIQSEDDLRNGSFTYIVMKGEEMTTPLENEILFTNDHYSYSPVMTWRYPQPRLITDLSVLPVPFHVSREEGEEPPGNIPCLLQYWDELNLKFVTCQQFSLSENDSSNVVIIEPDDLKSVEYCCSEIWRVVVGISQELESEAYEDDDDDDDEVLASCEETAELSVVPASSLAASMKVNSIFASKLVPSLETKFTISKLSIISSNSLSSLGKGSPSDLSPFYIDENDCYPDLIESIEFCFEDLHLTSSLVNNLKIAINFSSQLQLNVMDFNNLCWLTFLSSTPLTIWMKQLLCEDISLHKMSINMDVGTAELFVTQTAVHTLSLTARAWSNLLSNDPQFLVFNHYVICNETDEIIHLQQANTDEDIILHSGQMYPYSWCAKQSRSLRFCLDSVGDWKWSEPFDLDQVGLFPKKLEHKRFTSLLFVEVKMISGIQKQVIFHGSCSFLNNLDFDIRLSLVSQETQHTALHPAIVNVSKEYIIPAGTTRPSVTISPSFIKSVGIGKSMNEFDEEGGDEFVIPLPQKEDDTHFTVQVQDGEKSLLCWLSFDYTSKIFGQLVVTVTPQFIFRNHFPYPVAIKAISRDNYQSVEFTLDGKGHETQIFDLFPQKWFNVHFSLFEWDKSSTTAFPINTTMHELLKENNYITDAQLNDEKWPFLQGTEASISKKPDQLVCFKEVETEEVSIPTASTSSSAAEEQFKCRIKCSFQATLQNVSLPTIVIDIKPQFLITNETDYDIFIKTGECVTAVKSEETTALLHVQKELLFGICVNKDTIWSSPVELGNSVTGQPLRAQTLSPGAITHCSIMDVHNNHCYQFSFTSQNVYGMLSIALHKRFLVHNLSSSCLTMVPLMFNELKGDNVFDQLSALRLPPQSRHSFCYLNMMKSTSSTQVSDGMAMNFQLHTNDTSSQDVEDIDVSNYIVKESNSLQLSKEHLRETVILLDNNGTPHPFVLTSGLEDGILHIFIDEDVSIAVTLHNRSHLTFVMKEVNAEYLKKNKHAEVLLADTSSLLQLHPNSMAYYQPHTFKENFPRTENKLELNCQFALFSEEPAELSQPITIEKDKTCKLFIPNHGEIFIKACVSNSKLYVQISTVEEDEVSGLLLTHLTLPLFQVKLTTVNVILVDNSNHNNMIGLISTSLSRIELNHIINDCESVFKVTCGYVQVDNQVAGTLDHFPVLFLPMRQVSERYHTMTEAVPFAEIEACLEADVFSLTFEINDSITNGRHETFINNVRVNMQPCEMYIEDTMIYRLANVFYTYLPQFNATQQPTQFINFKSQCLNVLHPLMLCNIEIGEISILLSFHASLKMFLAADHIPLVFKRYKIMSTQTVTKEFIRSVLYNYATQALVRVGWILGSLNIIGSPTGLIQSIGHGLTDFFVLPYNGLIRGPSAFVSGISLGMSSLMKHISTGALTSLNNVSSSISRNMDRLSFDDLHLNMQEEHRADSPTKVSTGFSKAFESLGMSLLGAVAGIVDHPIQNVSEANNTSEVISGVVSGLAKGVVGMFTKPIGGAAEFVSQASQGILQGAGLVRVPEKVFLLHIDKLKNIVGGESHMKYMWQYLHSESYAEILVVPNVAVKTSNDEKVKGESYSGALVLTESALLVYNSEESKVTSIFPLREVELLKLEEDSSSSYKLQIYKHTNEEQLCTTSLDENPNFRQFFDSFRDAAVISHTEVLCENLSNRSQNAVLEVELQQIYGELLISLCQTKKVRLLEDTYVVDCVDL